jgi:hypothetical protein
VEKPWLFHSNATRVANSSLLCGLAADHPLEGVIREATPARLAAILAHVEVLT